MFVFHAEIIDPEATISGVPVRVLAVRFGEVSAVLLGALVLFVYFMVRHKEGLMRCVRWVLRPLPASWREKIEYLVEEFHLGCQVAKNPSALFKVTFWTVLVWAAIVLSYYPFYWAYDLENKTFQSVVLVTVFICVLITVLPTPAFLGSFQAAVLFALHEIMHEPEVTAVSFGMVSWAVNFGVLLVCGLYFILHDHLSVRNLVEIEEKGAELIEKPREG